jgi:hypothetical protein
MVKGTGYPLHSSVSPLLPLPCVTVCHHISTDLYKNDYCANQITWYLNRLSLRTALVGMVRPLLGSGRHGQATLYLFQKYLLCWEYQYIVYRNGIASVKVIFCVLSEFSFVKKNYFLQRNCRVLPVTRQCFWKVEKTYGAACVVPRLTSLPLHPPRQKWSSYLTKTVGGNARMILV